MTLLRDVIELKVILSRTATWSTSVFRNWISNQVAQWRCRFPSISDGEDDEEDQIESLMTKIAKLRISRTNSFKANNTSSVAETMMRETPQSYHSYPPHAAGQISAIMEATSQEATCMRATKPGHREEIKSLEEGVGKPITLTISPTISLTRNEATESHPHRLQAPREPRPRAASIGANPQRSSNPVSFRPSPCEPRLSTHEDTHSISGSEAERPRSFHAEDFSGAKFLFGNSSERYRNDGVLHLVKKHIRVFSAHDLDGEEFSFSTPSPKRCS